MPWICSSENGPVLYAASLCMFARDSSILHVCRSQKTPVPGALRDSFCLYLAVYNDKHLDKQLSVQYPRKAGLAFNHSKNQGLPGWVAIIPTWATSRNCFLPTGRVWKPPGTQQSAGKGQSPLVVGHTNFLISLWHNVKHRSSSSGGRWVC